VRLKFGDRFGPVREIHAGSGYWSQDSVVQVLGIPEFPTEVCVRWPGGKNSTYNLPTGAGEVTIDQKSGLKVIR